MEQKKIAAYTAAKRRGQIDSFDSRILGLPTVKEKNHKKDDNGISIQRSFYFNPLPVTESPLYYGVIRLLRRDQAEISLYPTFGFMRTLGENRDRFFTFYGSPLAFAEDEDGMNAKNDQEPRRVWGATKKFSSHSDAYFCLWSYYVWFVREVVPYLDLEELGHINRDHRALDKDLEFFYRKKPFY